MADGLDFADFGEAFDFGAHVVRAERFGGIDRRAHRAREADSAFLPGELRSKSSASFCEMWLRTFLIMPAPPRLRGCAAPAPTSVHVGALRHLGGAEQHAVGQFGIEAAERQAADDFLLQQAPC